jgi:hypothetical protein
LIQTQQSDLFQLQKWLDARTLQGRRRAMTETV